MVFHIPVNPAAVSGVRPIKLDLACVAWDTRKYRAPISGFKETIASARKFFAAKNEHFSD